MAGLADYGLMVRSSQALVTGLLFESPSKKALKLNVPAVAVSDPWKIPEVAIPAPFTLTVLVSTTLPEQLLPVYMVNITVPVTGDAAPIRVALSVTEPP